MEEIKKGNIENNNTPATFGAIIMETISSLDS